jgi:hypothetical protein
VRDEIFAATVRLATFNPLAGKRELRQFLKLINLALKILLRVLIPLRGKVNCDIETSERQQYQIL